MNKWVLLGGAIAVEVAATLSLRASQDNAGWLVVCAGGYRSVIGASVLQRAGFRRVASGSGGLDAARSAGVALVGETVVV